MSDPRRDASPERVRSRNSVFARKVVMVAVLSGCAACTGPEGGADPAAPATSKHEIRIGNYFVNSPYGISFIIDDETGFVITPDWDRPQGSRYGANDPSAVPPGTMAPDFSFFRAEFPRNDARITFTWGRVGEGAMVAMLETDRPAEMSLRFPLDVWPHFHAAYSATADGLTGYAIKPKGDFVPFAVRADPPPAFVRADIRSAV